jgi:hypothetical protein
VSYWHLVALIGLAIISLLFLVFAWAVAATEDDVIDVWVFVFLLAFCLAFAGALKFAGV